MKRSLDLIIVPYLFYGLEFFGVSSERSTLSRSDAMTLTALFSQKRYLFRKLIFRNKLMELIKSIYYFRDCTQVESLLDRARLNFN